MKRRMGMQNCRYDLDRYHNKFLMCLAWKLPKRLVMWCAIRVSAHATTGQFSDQAVPELTVMDALKRWEQA